MGDILAGIYDVARDARGRRITSRSALPVVPQEIKEPISITVDTSALVGSFTVSNVGTEVVEIFDPSAHTVAEVLEYAARNPDEIPAIVEAEQSGKQRKMVLSLS